MRRYTERYEYDPVGNFLRLIHQAANGNWTRAYAYDEPSLIEAGKQSNRLSSTTVGAGTPETVCLRRARQHDGDAASDADATGTQGPAAGHRPAGR